MWSEGETRPFLAPRSYDSLDPLTVRSDLVICPHRLNDHLYLLHIPRLQPICPSYVSPSLNLPLPHPHSVCFVSPSKGRLGDLLCGWINDRCSLKVFVHKFIVTSLDLVKSAFKIPGKQLSFSRFFLMDSAVMKMICYTESSHMPNSCWSQASDWRPFGCRA